MPRASDFVTLCMTMSAPKARGLWKKGDMKVLSTARSSPLRLAKAATASMSVSFSVGFEGVSHQIILVAGVMALSILAMSRMSTKEKVWPIWGPHTLRK